MAVEIFGNIKGLSASEVRALHKIGGRRVAADEIVSLDLAREIYSVANKLRRRIGVLLSREGEVEELCIGSKDILYLPDLGRYRFGKGRLRRLRLVFSDLSSGGDASIPSDHYIDLEKLRLDMVVGVRVSGNHTAASFAHIVPTQNPGTRAVHTEQVTELSALDLNFTEFMQGLENELSASAENKFVSGRTRAVLVGVHDPRDREAESAMAELHELARTAGLQLVDTVVQRRQPDPRTILGKGKVEEVILRCLRLGAELIVFATELRPSQWRAITGATELKVIDRSMLILDIFAQRAQSSEGRLQVELAQLKYNLPRLVEMDSGLSRLTGGIGGRGPGETKLEVGRRRIRDRINELQRRVDKISSERGLRRTKRSESGVPLVAILGYTNVGKSTLFNALTGSSVIAENKLFATLDPAQRRVMWQSGSKLGRDDEGAVDRNSMVEIVLSDTVGFIRKLPEELMSAFRATLEELDGAALLVHVIDASDPEVHARVAAVEAILASMKLLGIPRVVAVNKSDRVNVEAAQALVQEFGGVATSALEGLGLDQLRERILRELPVHQRFGEAQEEAV